MLAALEGKMPAIARVDCKQGIYQGGELEKEDKNIMEVLEFQNRPATIGISV